MAPEKKKNKNEFLDGSDSDDDLGSGYDSENELKKGGRSTKRRRLDESDRADDDDDFASGSDEEDIPTTIQSKEIEEEEGNVEGDEDRDEVTSKPQDERSKPSASELQLPDISRPLTRKNLVASEKAIKKSGVVYLSRVPPYMKPTKLRQLLEPYGTINRIFLAPEDPAAHTRRVRSGGNKKRTYTEGWVEFVRKNEAKAVCELLNARTIGGKKGSYYHDDIWNLLYLKGFKWHNLTEQIAAENAERTSRMRAEISKSTRENKDFVRNVERAKMLDGIQQSKAKKRKTTSASGERMDGGGGVHGGDDEKITRRADGARTFKQIPQAKKSRAAEEQQPEHVTRVLSKIF
jgi:ESF2/ABP1 family protein